MKRILYITAALVALAACNVTNIDKQSPAVVDGNSFVKGQKVTLTVGTGNQTKVSSELVTSGEDKDKVNFKWETGDKILVKVGEATAEFTLKSGAGSATATFEGTMPADGESFDVQYPLTDPVLTTQTYSATEAIPHNMMKFTATGCTVGDAFTLTAVNAALRLNLYGIDREISQIVITSYFNYLYDGVYLDSATYTLTFNEAVKVSNSKDVPTPFFIVVPAYKGPLEFKADLTLSVVSPSVDGALLRNYESEAIGKGTVISNGTLKTSVAQYFTAGSVLNMPAQSITTVWAPVNCGYDADHTYGLLYQWGRTAGCTYDAAWTMPSSHDAETQTQTAVQATWDENGYNKSPKSNEFYMNSSSPYDWYTNDASKQLTEWPMTAPIGTSGIGNPCPEGWRVPTESELRALKVNKSSLTTKDNQNGYYFSGSTTYSESVPSVFLPAAGYRDVGDSGARGRGAIGNYWSSVSGYFGWSSSDGEIWMEWCAHAFGLSVRCVQD